jgi:hypothetical protein
LKDLFVCAHYGEAQAFLEHSPFGVWVKETWGFESAEARLMITGEGLFPATAKTSWALGRFAVKRVVNVGVVGALDERLGLEEIHSIRTFFSEQDFKSFTSSDPKASMDLVSASQRIKNENEAKKLRPIAKVVDREAYGIALACNLFETPFYCFKWISDYPSQIVCDDVKAMALKASNDLCDYWLNFKDGIKHEDVATFPLVMTVTQQRRFNLLKATWKAREEVPLEQFMEPFVLAKHPPKKKAQYLLNAMEEKLCFLLND